MIRVLLLQQTIGSGGVERRRLSIATHFPKDSYELKIICTAMQGDFYKNFQDTDVELIEVGEMKHPFDYKIHKKVQTIIKTFKPHIIHGAVFEGVTMAAINGFLMRVPIVIIEETSDPINRRWKANLLMKAFSKVSDAVVGVSPSVTGYLKDTLKIPDRKVTLINNGVKEPVAVSSDEKSSLRKRLGILEDEIVILSVGRMVDDTQKRFTDLITAFSLLKKQIDKVKLVLVGDGIELKNYKKLAKKLEIENDVVFTGYHTYVDPYYAIADVFSLVSAREAFGLVLAEAMLHKLPIVATKVGGMQYIVKDEETGYLVESFNPEAVSQKLLLLCEQEALRTQLGLAGYKRAIEMYTETSYLKRLEDLYTKLLTQKGIQ